MVIKSAFNKKQQFVIKKKNIIKIFVKIIKIENLAENSIKKNVALFHQIFYNRICFKKKNFILKLNKN